MKSYMGHGAVWHLVLVKARITALTLSALFKVSSFKDRRQVLGCHCWGLLCTWKIQNKVASVSLVLFFIKKHIQVTIKFLLFKQRKISDEVCFHVGLTLKQGAK